VNRRNVRMGVRRGLRRGVYRFDILGSRIGVGELRETALGGGEDVDDGVALKR
jgi:hypothetical protein